MIRSIAEGVALFLMPFAIYAGALLAWQRLRPPGPMWAGRRVALLSIAGLGVVILATVVLGLLVPRGEGAYVPAHMEGGRLVPGRLQ